MLEPSEDEAWLIARCTHSEVADFEARSPGGTRPVIRAELLRRLLLCQGLDGVNPADLCPSPRLGLHVRGAVVLGRLRLADASGTHGDGACPPLVFEGCRFETGEPWPAPEARSEPVVDLRHARCSRVAFIDCELASLALGGAWIGGDVDLSGLHAPDSERGQCWVQARGARIQGTLRLSRARLRVEQAPDRPAGVHVDNDYACDLRAARVEGHVLGLNGLQVFGGMALPQHVDGDVLLEGARLRCTQAPRNNALLAQSCEVSGLVLLRAHGVGGVVRRFESEGQMDLYGLRIGGSFALSGARLVDPGLHESEALLRANMLDVRGSVFMADWQSSNDNGETSEMLWTTVEGKAAIDFRGACIGTDLYLGLDIENSACCLWATGIKVAGDMHVSRVRSAYQMEAAQIGRNLRVSASDDATATLNVQDAQIGGNLWLSGHYAEIRAWGCQVKGQFGGREYEAVSIVAPGLTVHGESYFRVRDAVNLEGAHLVAAAEITSFGKVPGIDVRGAHLSAERDFQFAGPLRQLLLTSAKIGGSLQAGACSVNEATLNGIRVQGSTWLPRNVFGPLSLAGGRFDGSVHVETVRLHVRRRPSGQTAPKLDFSDARLDGDLYVVGLERVPARGVLEEVVEEPAWMTAIDASAEPGGRRPMTIYRRALSFYDHAEVIELHLPATEPTAEADAIDVHAFLLMPGGRTVYLNGGSPPIHAINAPVRGKSPLRLERSEQVEDYARFFCGYVWGEEGAFILVDSLEESEWLRYLEKDAEKFDNLPVPLRVERDGDAWVCHAVVLYADYLFRATFRVRLDGRVDMTEDIPIARTTPQGVSYPKPHRRYRMALLPGAPDAPGAEVPATEPTVAPNEAPPPHTTPHRVIQDRIGWTVEEDAAARQRDVERIRAELAVPSKKLVELDKPLPVVIDLRGCRCAALEDNHGQGWGDGLTVDLRGFEYADLAEGSTGYRREANEAFSGPSIATGGDIGARLGRARYEWVERVTGGLDFSVTPFEQLVRALARRGDLEAARTVVERRLQQENERRPWWQRWSVLMGVQWPFRFGLFSSRGIVTTLLYWLLGVMAFDVANYAQLRFPPLGAVDSRLIVGRLPLPTQPVLMVDSQPVTMSVVSTEAGDKLVTAKVPQNENQAQEVRCGDQIEPSLYALDIMLPLVDLQQEAKCTISSADGWGPFGWRLFRALYALGGAYVTSMLILTLSGVLRRSIER